VNVGERYKSVTFTTYLHESKELVNVVNVVRGYFGLSRTWHAKFEAPSRRQSGASKPPVFGLPEIQSLKLYVAIWNSHRLPDYPWPTSATGGSERGVRDRQTWDLSEWDCT
jgi:hypothetical protein